MDDISAIDESQYDEPAEAESSKPGLFTILITLLVLLSMLSALAWPLLRPRGRSPSTPSPTPAPVFLLEA
jgi:hypothetical protein